MATTVGVRELRQNLSKYLERLEGGESFDITSRGRQVGRLTPWTAPGSVEERLVAMGATLATKSLVDLWAEDREPVDGVPSQQILDELREDRV